MSQDRPDLEARWRDWRRDGAPEDPVVTLPPGLDPGPPATSRLRPPGRQAAVLVFCVLTLLAAAVLLVSRLGGDRGPRAALPGADGRSPAASVPVSDRPSRDLTRLASATASSFAGSTADASGVLVSYFPANVLDGDPTTAWRTDGPGDGEQLTLEFATTVTVTRVGIAAGEPDPAATGDATAFRRGRSVQQVTWTAADQSVEQVLDPTVLDVQLRSLPVPVTTRTLVVRLDRTGPGPVRTDDFAAVTQVVVLGAT